MTKKTQKYLGFALFTLIMLGDGLSDVLHTDLFHLIVYERMFYIYLLPLAFILYSGQFYDYVGALKRSVILNKRSVILKRSIVSNERDMHISSSDALTLKHFMVLMAVTACLGVVGHIIVGLIKLDAASNLIYLYPGIINLALFTGLLEFVHYVCYKRLKYIAFLYRR